MFKPYLSEMDINIKDIHEGFSTYWITKTARLDQWKDFNCISKSLNTQFL